MIVAKKFTSEKQMLSWIADKENTEKLKVTYPSAEYSAELNLIDKQVEVTKR